MKKSEFIARLKERLSILTDDERKDIIDEYTEYIDNKISEGKSEEQAVSDFGDVDELAREILKAYKINDNYSKKEEFKTQATEVFNDITTFLTNLFNSAFSGMSTQGISSFIVLALTSIILCILLRIPFWLIEGLGMVLLRILLPNALEWIFVGAWQVIVLCFYLLTCVITIKNLYASGQFTSGETKKKDTKVIIPKRKNTEAPKETSDNIIEAEIVSEKTSEEVVVEETKKKKATKKDQQSNLKDSELKLTEKIEDSSETIEETSDEEKEDADEDNFSEIEKDFINPQASKKKLTFSGIILKCVKLILQLFAAICIIPFVFIMVGLIIALGCEIYLLMLGSSVIGITLLTLAALIFAIEFSSLIWKALVGSKRKMITYLISLIAFALLVGVGTLTTVSEFANYKIEPSPLIQASEMDTRTNRYYINDTTHFWIRTHSTAFEIDETLADNEIVIDYHYPKQYSLYIHAANDNTNYDYSIYFSSSTSEEIKLVQKAIKTIFNGLKKNTLYQLDSYSMSTATVYMNQNMFDNALDEGYYEGFSINYIK